MRYDFRKIFVSKSGRSSSNSGSPPQATPVGSIHIITAPPTAPMPMKRVRIFSKLIILF